MKKTIFFYFFFCLIISCSKDSETDAISEDVSKNSLIVGYLPASLGLSPVISFVLAAILLFIIFRLIGSVPKANYL